MQREILSIIVLLAFFTPILNVPLTSTIEPINRGLTPFIHNTSILPKNFEVVSNQQNYVLNQLLIAFKEDEQAALERLADGTLTLGILSIDQLNRKHHLVDAQQLIEEDVPPLLSNIYLLTFPSGTDIPSLVEEYGADLCIEVAEPNYLYTPCHMPNDSHFTQQWSLHNTGQTGGTPGADINAPEAWDIEQGDPNITIAILDSGVDYTNPDIGNCTEGLTEVNYILESPHPLNGAFSEEVNFPTYDTVSLHIARFETETNPGFLIWNSINKSFLNRSFFDINVTMFDGSPYNGTGSYLWTRYSESNNSIYITANQSNGSTDHWGFMIDKLKGLVWKPLSEQSTKYIDGYDFYNNDPDPMDTYGHGTHCAGIASAVTDNGYGIAGIAGDCHILPVRIGGSWFSLSAILRGIVFAVNRGARVISMSFGGPQTYLCNLVLSYANARNVVLVAAAGNNNWNVKYLSAPARYDQVIAIAATDANDSKAQFSNYGSWVDVAAPGVDILSLRAHGTDMDEYPPGQTFVPAFDHNATLCYASGTSMACPTVAGIVGLVLSRDPSLTPAQVRTVIRSSTDAISSPLYIGTGRINALTAVQKAAPVVAEFDHTLDDTVVSTDSVTLRGVAEGEQFSDYCVDYAFGIYPSNDSWIPLCSSPSPQRGVLASLETRSLEEGLYTIRLRVNASEHTYQDIMLIVVNKKSNTFFVDLLNTNGPWLGTEDHPFISIQYAIECCGRQGDRINVSSGVYTEMLNVVLDPAESMYGFKDVRIYGAGKNSTILDGKGIFPLCLHLYSSRFTHFTGFTIMNYSICVFCERSFCNVISENNFHNYFILTYTRFNFIFSNNFQSYTDIISSDSFDFWYHPLKLHGNYWDDYQERYPNAQPRLLTPWAWNTPYKILSILQEQPFAFTRFTPNNDRFPCIAPT